MAGNKKSGGPAFNATKDSREKVCVFKAQGLSNQQIASALEISEPTL